MRAGWRSDYYGEFSDGLLPPPGLRHLAAVITPLYPLPHAQALSRRSFLAGSVATEFVGTWISSGGDGTAAPKNTDQLLVESPCVKYFNTERGYVRCELTPKQWCTDYRTVPFVTKPGAPLKTRASGCNASAARCPPSCLSTTPAAWCRTTRASITCRADAGAATETLE